MAPAALPIRVVGEAVGGADFVEMVIDEAPLRRAMLKFSGNLLLLSLLISGLTAVAVYVALNWLIVGPIRQLAANVMEFEVDPGESAPDHRRRRSAPTRSARPSARSRACR